MTTPRILIAALSACLLAGPGRAIGARNEPGSATAEPKPHVAVAAAGRGRPYLNLRDGRPTTVEYLGDDALTAALQSGAARPLAMASADFDGNGTPDVVAAYALGDEGLVTVQRGNPDAFAPADDSVYVRMQQGYDPASLLPVAAVYPAPEAPTFLAAGNFTGDASPDILFASSGGGLYVMAGDGTGGFRAPREIPLPGVVTALATGEFRAADGYTDVAVGVSGREGDALFIFDDATEGFSTPLVELPLGAPVTAIEFGGLDDDPFQDVAAATGTEVVIVHGWGRGENVATSSRLERVDAGAALRGLAIGRFIWDRQGRNEIAALGEDAAIRLVQDARLDTRPFTEDEKAQRTRGNARIQAASVDVESTPSWRKAKAGGWVRSSTFRVGSAPGANPIASRPLLRANLSYQETDDLLLIDELGSRLDIVRPSTASANAPGAEPADVTSTLATLDVEAEPVAVLPLPRKLNGVRDLLVLDSSGPAITPVPNAPNTTITVDRTDDPLLNGANPPAAQCTAANNDCSLRGAILFANQAANNNTTINLPANTYILSINGTSSGGCDGNAVGDLELNQTMTLTGAGAATTIIRQTGTGPANDGDRIMCMNNVFAPSLVYNFSGLTFVGGREGSAAGTGTVLGGAGIIGGELDNSLTMTNVVMANNQETVSGSFNGGGGGLQITGGNLNITNCTFGGTGDPGAYTDRTSTNTGNLQTGSGGGLTFTPSSPRHMGGTGILTVAGTTFSHNIANGIGGGGAELLIFAFASPGGIGSGSATIGTSTFSANHGSIAGAIAAESLPTTLKTSTLSGNSASNRGGGIYVGGIGLTLDGTLASINFTGNTAPNGGTSVSTAGPVTVKGTNTTIGGSIEITSGGSWTNEIDSALAPTDVVITGGSFTCKDNSTMNVGGNVTFGPAAIQGATFTGSADPLKPSTVNIAGKLTISAGGSGPATTFNAGTSHINVAGEFGMMAGGSTAFFSGGSAIFTVGGNFTHTGSDAGAFNSGTGTFIFNGTGAQSISTGTPLTFNNLTDSNTSNPLTLNSSVAVNGTLNVNGTGAILSPVADTVITGAGTLTGTGTVRASRTAATADFLTQYAISNKTLTSLTVDYNGAGAQTVNNGPAYSNLTISGTGTKTLQGVTGVGGNLNIAAATLASGNFNLLLSGNWTNNATFSPGTGTVLFGGSGGTQSITGNTTFYNVTLSNNTNFGIGTTTIGNDLVASGGTMDGGTSTVVFTGVTDNAGSISGAAAKNFWNLQINSPATISNTTGGGLTVENNFTNGGTFTQAAGLTTTFSTDNNGDGAHTLSGAGTTTFGNVAIAAANSVDAGGHNFSVAGASFGVDGSFTGNTGTVAFSGAAAQSISGNGTKGFNNLTISNANGVTVANATPVVDASVGGILSLGTDLTVAAGAVLQQSGTSSGTADVIGTVRRTDLGVASRAFGNLNNTVTINSGTPPTQLDVNLVKAAPGTFPATVKVVPRDITLTPTGGSGIAATVRLRYIDPAELAGITESRLILWKNVGGVWTPQGGAVDTTNNFVSLGGVTSFSEWAIGEGSDLTLTKVNSVSGSAVTGQPWNWTLTATNTGAPATFAAGQTILSDDLPTSNLNYGPVSVQNVSNITGSANVACAIASNTLTCTASGGAVTFASNVGASKFDVVFQATPQAAGTYQNPRAGGTAQIDPSGLIAESNEGNNSPTTNTVTVGKASTTTTITSDDPDPSVVGQAATVHWTVAVNSPGAVGTALTGNVTVTDGTASCSAAVSAGQCDVTFTSAGAKSLVATYAGDTNYNGSASSPATAHTVNLADTTTTITTDNPDPSAPAQSVTVQWTVTVNPPGSGTPTGNVTVTVSGGAETCSAPVASNQCSLALNATGSRTLTATYAGDTKFKTSSDTESHQVCPPTVVTSAADTGAGSLRQIVAGACAGYTVTFDAAGTFSTPQTITLTSGEILVDKDLKIDARPVQVTVSGNDASRVLHVAGGSTATILGLTVSHGAATGGAGILDDGALTLVDSTLTANAASGDGGAIATSATSTGLTLINTTISGNGGNGSGGGIAAAGGTVTAINTTVTANKADADGNGTGTGGGLTAQAGTVVLRNTIVAGNLNEDGAVDSADDIAGTVDATSSFDLIGTGGSGGLTNGVNGNQVGVADAGLGSLASNGGTTQTHALLPSSPAIEAGSNANLPADTYDLDGDANTAEPLPVDQRGTSFPRVADAADADTTATVDIGAFELHPAIEDVPNQTTAEDTAKPVVFHLGDDTGSLVTSVTATSSNTSLVTNDAAHLAFTGSGGTRTLTITPNADVNSPANGTTTITITVTATNGRTATDTFDLTVTEVNDPPTATDDPLTAIDEDSGTRLIPIATLLANDSAGPANESGQTLGITGVSSPVGGTVQINGANVEFTPATNFFGPASFVYTVADNGTTAGSLDAKSDTATVTFTVNPVNDPPSFTIASNPPVVFEDAGAQTVNGFASAISQGPGESGQVLTFSVSPTGTTGNLTFSTPPAIDSSGTLTYTATDGTSGSATFDATLSDDGSNTPPSSNASAPHSFTVRVLGPNDAPVVAKAFSPDSIVSGNSSTLTITLTNNGTDPITNLAVTDNIPAGVTIVDTGTTSPFCTTGTLVVTATQISLSGATIPANPPSGGTCAITVTVTSTVPGVHVNTIAAGSITSDLGTNAAPATDDLTVQNAITVTKAFSASPVLVGATSHLTVTLANVSGASASGVAMTDTYPGGLVNAAGATTTCPGGAATAVAGGGTLQLSGATLAAGASCKVEVDVTSSTPGSYPNTVAAGDVTSSLGPNSASNTATVIFSPAANLGVTKTGNEPVAPGTHEIYTITVHNFGPSTATNVVAHDVGATPASAVTLVKTVGCAEDAVPGGGIPDCHLGSLAVGADVSYTVDYVINPSAPASISNTVSVSSDAVDTTPGNNSATETSAIDSVAPTVTKLDTLSSTGDGVLGECETARVDVHDFVVTFSEAMATSGDGDVTDPIHYRLVRPAPGAFFDVDTCADAVGSDTEVIVGPVSYDTGTHRAVVTVNSGAQIADGLARLIVCGTLTDVAGNALEGSDSPATDLVRTFRVDTYNLLSSGHFDTFDGFCDHTHADWDSGDAPLEIDTADASGSPLSGSVHGVEKPALVLSQCAPVPGAIGAEMGLAARVDVALPELVTLTSSCTFYGTANCSGPPLGTITQSAATASTAGAFVRTSHSLTIPPTALAARCSFASGSDSGADFDSYLDELFLRRSTIHQDGFESGNTAAWSATETPP